MDRVIGLNRASFMKEKDFRKASSIIMARKQRGILSMIRGS
jgi:hypothetical protein